MRNSRAEVVLADRYDLVVVGGGIHGAGVAQAAAAHGYSVLVLERTALAAGTSSRSSKLIHGGLRYLESGQFALVRECLHERALLLKLAPELVRMRPFYLPVYKDARRGTAKIRLGLSLYTLLAGLGRDARFHIVPRAQWQQLDGLDCERLRAVFCYPDAQTDDAALTRAVMQSAVTLGAELRVPAPLLHAECGRDGVRVQYYDGETYECQARVLVNAAGPWANEVLARIEPQPPHFRMDLVQGTHILVPGGLTQGIYYLEVPRDRRAIFVMPWREHTLVGTTETRYHGDPGAVQPLPAEIDYLWEALCRHFPRYAGAPRRILESFAGLRVLPARAGAPFTHSRETVLLPDRARKPRVLTVYGGKLTAYRATAAAVMARLQPALPARKAVADTRTLPLEPA